MFQRYLVFYDPSENIDDETHDVTKDVKDVVKNYKHTINQVIDKDKLKEIVIFSMMGGGAVGVKSRKFFYFSSNYLLCDFKCFSR